MARSEAPGPGSADALRNTIDNLCVVAGPALGAALLVVGRPWVALVANAATCGVSAALIATIRTCSVPVDETEGGEVRPLRQTLLGLSPVVASRC